MVPICFSVDYTLQDYRDGYQLYYWHVFLREKLPFKIFLVVDLILLAVIDYVYPQSSHYVQIWLFVLISFVVLLPFFLYRMSVRFIKKNYRSCHADFVCDEKGYSVTSHIVGVHIEQKAESRSQWSAIRRTIENKRSILLLAKAGRSIVIIPKRIFPSPQEEAVFKQCLKNIISA